MDSKNSEIAERYSTKIRVFNAYRIMVIERKRDKYISQQSQTNQIPKPKYSPQTGARDDILPSYSTSIWRKQLWTFTTLNLLTPLSSLQILIECIECMQLKTAPQVNYSLEQ